MRSGDDVVVTLPEARCAQLVAGGAATPSGSGGRAMRQWVRIGRPDPGRWRACAEEALGLLRGTA